jgi:Ca2+-binding RTX toxin-like protein
LPGIDGRRSRPSCVSTFLFADAIPVAIAA